MSRLADRVARLEEALSGRSKPVCPVFLITMDDRGDDSQPLEIQHEGRTWIQEDDEDSDAFLQRAKVDAMKTFRPAGLVSALFLVACRPSLTQEQWLARHNTWATDDGQNSQEIQQARVHTSKAPAMASITRNV